MSSTKTRCWLPALLICCAVWSVAAQVSVRSVVSQVQNSRLAVVVTLGRWQGNFSYQLTVPAGEARSWNPAQRDTMAIALSLCHAVHTTI